MLAVVYGVVGCAPPSAASPSLPIYFPLRGWSGQLVKKLCVSVQEGSGERDAASGEGQHRWTRQVGGAGGLDK